MDVWLDRRAGYNTQGWVFKKWRNHLVKTQQGSLFKSHGAWYVRYREWGNQNPIAHRLASLAEYPKRSEVIPLKNAYIDRLNRIGFTPEAGVGIVDFVEKSYFPAIEKKLARSSVKGYKDDWYCHIKDRVKGRVRDFRTVDGENLMGEIEAHNKTEADDLAHGTYKHIKVTLSAMFTFAKTQGSLRWCEPNDWSHHPQGEKAWAEAPRLCP